MEEYPCRNAPQQQHRPLQSDSPLSGILYRVSLILLLLDPYPDDLPSTTSTRNADSISWICIPKGQQQQHHRHHQQHRHQWVQLEAPRDLLLPITAVPHHCRGRGKLSSSGMRKGEGAGMREPTSMYPVLSASIPSKALQKQQHRNRRKPAE